MKKLIMSVATYLVFITRDLWQVHAYVRINFVGNHHDNNYTSKS